MPKIRLRLFLDLVLGGETPDAISCPSVPGHADALRVIQILSSTHDCTGKLEHASDLSVRCKGWFPT